MAVKMTKTERTEKTPRTSWKLKCVQLEGQVADLEAQLKEALETQRLQETQRLPRNSTASQSPSMEMPEGLPELDTSLLRPRKGDSRVDKLVDEIRDIAHRISKNELLWPFRAFSAGAGLGSWTETPRPLQVFIRGRVASLMSDQDWLHRQVYLKSCLNRTWAPMAMFRTLAIIAGNIAFDEATHLAQESKPCEDTKATSEES